MALCAHHAPRRFWMNRQIVDLLQSLKYYMPYASINHLRRLKAKFVRGYRPELAKPLGQELCLTGTYSSWSAAQADSAGYDAGVILECTRAALLKVKRGEAVYERDSVLFNEVQYAWPLLAGLLWVAAKRGGRVEVLDFGGSLGSTWFQNRAFLSGLEAVGWNVVEQPATVEVGLREFADETLRFYPSVAACLADRHPDVIILSSVLQYLEHPYDLLDELARLTNVDLIIDRTPFWEGAADRLCVQQVPPTIYPASYPSWIFAEARFRSMLSLHWDEMARFDNADRLPGPVPFAYRGFLAARRVIKGAEPEIGAPPPESMETVRP